MTITQTHIQSFNPQNFLVWKVNEWIKKKQQWEETCIFHNITLYPQLQILKRQAILDIWTHVIRGCQTKAWGLRATQKPCFNSEFLTTASRSAVLSRKHHCPPPRNQDLSVCMQSLRYNVLSFVHTNNFMESSTIPLRKQAALLENEDLYLKI